MMNERQLIEHVLTLVRQVIAEKNLGTRPKAATVINALGFPSPRRIPLPDGTDGARSGKQIFVSSQLTCWERIEFTLFHELLHILLDEDGEVISQLLDHFYHRPDVERNRLLENLCNIGAAEFMLPALEFIAVMRTGGWRLGALATASQTFEASVIACGFQFAHHNPDHCIMVVCEQGVLHRKEKNLALLEDVYGSCLHVAYTAYHPEVEYRMCRFVPVPPHHPINHVWNNQTAIVGVAPGFFSKSRAWEIPCEIAAIGGRVYAAYYPKGRKYQSDQTSLFEDW